MKVNKQNIINKVSQEIISVSKITLDLIKVIDENTYIPDEIKNTVKVIIEHKMSSIDTAEITKEIYEKIENTVFDILSDVKNYQKDSSVIIRLFEGISIEGIYKPERTDTFNFTGEEIVLKESIKVKPHISRRYNEKVNDDAFNN